MKTLLVPIDFSDATTHVLKHAADMARGSHSRIVLLHVLEPVATYIPVGASMDILSAAPPPVEFEDDSAQKHQLEKTARSLETHGVKVETISIVGLAVDEIVEQAKMAKADMIILGSHGHGALYHLFSGSVVTGVLKRATCPVLVIPVHKAKK